MFAHSVLEPLDISDDAIILEFKDHDPEDGEETLLDNVQAALKQIDEKSIQQCWKQKELLKNGFKSMDLRLKENRF